MFETEDLSHYHTIILVLWNHTVTLSLTQPGPPIVSPFSSVSWNAWPPRLIIVGRNVEKPYRRAKENKCLVLPITPLYLLIDDWYLISPPLRTALRGATVYTHIYLRLYRDESCEVEVWWCIGWGWGINLVLSTLWTPLTFDEYCILLYSMSVPCYIQWIY
jgi:hypothetical protein